MLSDAAFHSFALYYFPRFGALRTKLRLTRGAVETACRNNRHAMTVSLSTLRKIEKGQPVSFQKVIAAFDAVNAEHHATKPEEPALREDEEVIPALFVIPNHRRFRMVAKLSLAEIADRSDTATETIKDLEAGRCVTRATAERVAETLAKACADRRSQDSNIMVLADPASKPKAARERVTTAPSGSPAPDAED